MSQVKTRHGLFGVFCDVRCTNFAQGSYHCDIIYCRETYCQMDFYKEKYKDFAL